jgi:hypothetical protein
VACTSNRSTTSSRSWAAIACISLSSAAGSKRAWTYPGALSLVDDPGPEIGLGDAFGFGLPQPGLLLNPRQIALGPALVPEFNSPELFDAAQLDTSLAQGLPDSGIDRIDENQAAGDD